MATSVGNGAPFEPNLAAQQAKLGKIGDLSRIVDDDIKVLKTNLAQFRYLHEGDGETGKAHGRAWKAHGRRSGLGLPTTQASTQLTEIPPANGTAGAIPQSAEPAGFRLSPRSSRESGLWRGQPGPHAGRASTPPKYLQELWMPGTGARQPDGQLRQALRQLLWQRRYVSSISSHQASARQLA